MVNFYEKTFFYIFFGIILLGVIFELTILGMAFFNADEINCNLIWCEFKTTNSDTTITQNCYENDIKINCSEINFDYDKIDNYLNK